MPPEQQQTPTVQPPIEPQPIGQAPVSPTMMSPVGTMTEQPKKGKRILKRALIAVCSIIALLFIVGFIGAALGDKDSSTTGNVDKSSSSTVSLDYSCYSVQLPSGFVEGSTGFKSECGDQYVKETDGRIYDATFSVINGTKTIVKLAGNAKTDSVSVAGQTVDRTLQDLRSNSVPNPSAKKQSRFTITYDAISLNKKPTGTSKANLYPVFTLYITNGKDVTDAEIADFTTTVSSVMSSLVLK